MYNSGLLSAFRYKLHHNRLQTPNLDIHQHTWNGNYLRIYRTHKNPRFGGKSLLLWRDFSLYEMYQEFAYKWAQVCKFQVLMGGGNPIRFESLKFKLCLDPEIWKLSNCLSSSAFQHISSSKWAKYSGLLCLGGVWEFVVF